MAGGRPEKYTTHIQPFLKQIEQWWIYGNTNRWIAEQLKVSYQFLQKMIVEKKELKELYEQIPYKRVSRVNDLKEAMYKSAVGFDYEEEKIYIEANEEGTVRKKKEIYKKKSLPNVIAQDKMLQQLDDTYIPNKAHYKLKEKELDFKIEQAKKEMEDWQPLEEGEEHE